MTAMARFPAGQRFDDWRDVPPAEGQCTSSVSVSSPSRHRTTPQPRTILVPVGSDAMSSPMSYLTVQVTSKNLMEICAQLLLNCTAIATSISPEFDDENQEAKSFLESLYAQVRAGALPAATDAVIEHLDCMLNENRFAACNHLLKMVDLARIPSRLRRAFLMVTCPAKSKLPGRASFYAEALRLLGEQHGPEKAAKMLKTLI